MKDAWMRNFINGDLGHSYMKILIVRPGIFKEILSREDEFFDIFSIKESTNNIVYRFALDLNEIGKFECHFFCNKCELLFSLNKADQELVNTSKIIEADPSFFIFLLPFPHLEFYRSTGLYSEHLYGGQVIFRNMDNSIYEYNTSNCIPYKILEDTHAYIPDEKIFEKVLISNNKDCLINDFLSKPLYPIFINSTYGIELLIHDFKSIFKEHFEAELPIDSFSKIIIPFFESKSLDFT